MEAYYDTECKWLLPRFMREDPFDAALSRAIDRWGEETAESFGPLAIWPYIDQMAEADLDALAVDMAIPFYNAGFPLESKREIVKTSRLVQARLGTKWAVDHVMGIYFSDPANVVEWWDYGGEPGHFQVELTWGETLDSESKRFMPVLYSVKRAGAILDEVYAIIPGTAEIRAGAYPEERVSGETDATVAKGLFEFGGSAGASFAPYGETLETVECTATVEAASYEFGGTSAAQGIAVAGTVSVTDETEASR